MIIKIKENIIIKITFEIIKKMRTSGLVLFVCSGLLLTGGVVLGGATAWSLLRMSYLFWTTDLGVELGSCVLFVAGGLLCLPACWLATIVPYHPRSLSLLATLMFLVTAGMLLLSTGLVSLSNLSRALREPALVNASMLHALTREQFEPAVRSAFSAMQLELKCCGVQAYNDWYMHRRSLPPSCCDRVTNSKRNMFCTTPWHTSGCLRPALLELRYFSNSVSILATAIVIVMASTLFAAAYNLVVNVVDRAEVKPHPQPLRIECLGAHAHMAPLVPLTSPVAMPVTVPAHI